METKIDVSYEYRFLEFTTLSAGEYRHPVLLVPGEPGPSLTLQPHPGQGLQLRLPDQCGEWGDRQGQTGEVGRVGQAVGN